MPQPFKRLDLEMRMAPSVVGEGGGAFGVLIALIGSHWNHLEQTLGTMYTWLLLGQEPSAFEFYHDLIDLSLREKAFMAAARNKLSPELTGEITELFKKLRKLSGRRAKIIHGVWCSTPTKPMSLFLCDSREMGKQLNKMLKYLVDAHSDASKLAARRQFHVLPEDFEEYHVRDFQTLLNDLVAAATSAEALSNKVLARSLELLPKPLSPQGGRSHRYKIR
jgi:hypothetical protein